MPHATEPKVDDPEAQALIRKTLLNHYMRWMDTPIPALRQCTPRQAVATVDGSEQVSALLHSAERRDVGLSAAENKAIIDTIRIELGLPSR